MGDRGDPRADLGRRAAPDLHPAPWTTGIQAAVAADAGTPTLPTRRRPSTEGARPVAHRTEDTDGTDAQATEIRTPQAPGTRHPQDEGAQPTGTGLRIVDGDLPEDPDYPTEPHLPSPPHTGEAQL